MREMTLRVAGASRSQNFKNNAFSSTGPPDLLNLLALHFLIVQLDHDLDDLAFVIAYKPDIGVDVGDRETAVIFRLQLFFGVTLWLAKELVTFVSYNKD